MSTKQLKQLKNRLKENRDDDIIRTLLKEKINEIEKSMNKVKTKRGLNREIKYLTKEEFERLIKIFEAGENYYNENNDNYLFKYYGRDKLIFLLAYECGLRATELSTLKIKDYHEKSREIFCRRLKGSKNNTIRLTLKTSKLLKEHIKKRNREGYIFLSRKSTPLTRQHLTRLCKKYFKVANIPEEKRHFHTLKHTAGVHLAEQGLDIKEVQYILGHRNIENTLIYFDFTSKQQEVLYSKIGRD